MIDLKLGHWWAGSSKTNKTKQNQTKITKFESWFEINHKKHSIKEIEHVKIKINRNFIIHMCLHLFTSLSCPEMSCNSIGCDSWTVENDASIKGSAFYNNLAWTQSTPSLFLCFVAFNLFIMYLVLSLILF